MGRSPDRRDHSSRHTRDRRDDRGHQRSRSRDGHRSAHSGSKSHRHRDRSNDRRDRSHDRKRHREASPVKSRRADRDGYRDSHDSYDDRDRKRARHEDKSYRRERDSKDASRDKSGHWVSSSRSQDAPDEEEKKRADRLARVQAMKQQQSTGASTAEGNGLVASEEKPKPAFDLNAKPRTMAELYAKKAAQNAARASAKNKPDPTAVQERAAALLAAREKSLSGKALGSDVVVPKPSTEAQPDQQWKQPVDSAQSVGKFGIGIARPQNDKIKTVAKTATGMDEEDDSRTKRKIELLPDMPATLDNSDMMDQDEDNDERIVSDDEEQDAEAVESAQRRAKEAQESLHADAEAERDSRGPAETQESTDVAMQDADEDDPLEAYMKSLEMPTEQSDVLADIRTGQGRKKVFSADDDEVYDVDASKLGLKPAKKAAKKDLPRVDHSKIDYEDFRKSFYTPSAELTALSKEQVAEMREELDNIKVKGKDVPVPIQSFSQGGFGAQILDIMKEREFDTPTAIQAQALPAVMSGRDVIGVAKTGSGKTMAYLLPMLRHVKAQRPVENMEGPIGLILAPTRELVTQIFKEAKPYLDRLGLRGICAYGGSPLQECINDFKRGAEICVTTAGRFIDVLTANNGRVTNLRRVTYLVLDEADRMFDMGFEPIITRILGNTRPDRQTVLFSATFPKSMETLARKALKNPVEILVGGRSIVAPEIEQIVEVREQKTKLKRTLELLGELHALTENDDRSLLFVERQENADMLNVELTKRGYTVRAIHGGHDQIDRDQWISDFKAGDLPTLIATSVAARGLDVKQLKLVINWDCPSHNEDYVHRCGRTGRAGQTGTAVTYVTPEQDKYAPFLVKALTDSKKPVPDDLKELAESFEEKVKAGTVKKHRVGFGGKGVEQYSAARDAQRARERKAYAGPDGEEEEAPAADKAKTEDDKDQDKEKDPAALIAAASSTVTARDGPDPPAQKDPNAHLRQLLKDAMVVSRHEKPEPTKTSSAGAPVSAADRKARIAAAMRNIENRVSGKGVPAVDKRGPDAGEFSATLQVNDFPQRARWGVTNRSNVAKILDATGTSITTKGNYYAPGAEPGEGDQPKLYILVEGETQNAVETAMKELTQRLLAGIEQDQTDAANKPAGRYSIL